MIWNHVDKCRRSLKLQKQPSLPSHQITHRTGASRGRLFVVHPLCLEFLPISVKICPILLNRTPDVWFETTRSWHPRLFCQSPETIKSKIRVRGVNFFRYRQKTASFMDRFFSVTSPGLQNSQAKKTGRDISSHSSRTRFDRLFALTIAAWKTPF